ncbi:nucleoside triphosphate pyrophosphohydrolase [Salisediminibacterium halotolerans]|uniref:Tetrapyrrole methylase family protein / MazG family protein n=1 Tax=Salisediminibacterium halotolerans TaxID=517425 RepID=A0A1H9VRT7_9BACI|nr:nucleoside triphosphate pyrophosphohydrolase [Salisediminibacterium haloalkalitolerans]SES24446.1 tetrapyrrole methylase family protein / MazG family protein [Salisediminibacterium haloalkalitolerans]
MKPQIEIIGLGAGDIDQLPLGVYKQLQRADEVHVRTKDHPLVTDLEAEGIRFTGYDKVYEAHDDFEQVYAQIAASVLEKAEQQGTLVYAVPGHPLVAELTVKKLLESEWADVHIRGGQSFLDPLFSALKIDPIEGFQLLDGLAMSAEDVSLTAHTVIAQVFDDLSASHVKLKLMERLPDDMIVKVVTAAGTENETISTIALYELDRARGLSNLTAVYVPPVTDESLLYGEFSKLRDVIRELRGPNGCPWDKKQTHASLKRYAIEEVYELIDAIDAEDDDHMVEELGDVLLQVLLHAQIGEDEGFYNMEDVIAGLTDKMIRRHPHVFGETSAETDEDVVRNWEAIKQQEKEPQSAEGAASSLLDGIPASLPALLKAYNVQKKAAKVGFDWGDEAPMWMKLQEELAEWLTAVKAGDQTEAAAEFGDVLFAFVNLARFHQIEPEEALQKTTAKFMKRFEYIETKLAQKRVSWEDKSLAELDELWEEAKKIETGGEADENR